MKKSFIAHFVFTQEQCFKKFHSLRSCISQGLCCPPCHMCVCLLLLDPLKPAKPINPIQTRLWRDVMDLGLGRGHYGPNLVFQLQGYQKPKTEPWHIFGAKNNLKSYFGQFQALSLVVDKDYLERLCCCQNGSPA